MRKLFENKRSESDHFSLNLLFKRIKSGSHFKHPRKKPIMNEDALSQLYLKDTAFQDLMQKRIFNVLLVASPYDAFMMEEDGRIEEQLYFEYVALNLSSPPRVTKVSTTEQAMEAMEEKHFGLTIMMPGSDISETLPERAN